MNENKENNILGKNLCLLLKCIENRDLPSKKFTETLKAQALQQLELETGKKICVRQ